MQGSKSSCSRGRNVLNYSLGKRLSAPTAINRTIEMARIDLAMPTGWA